MASDAKPSIADMNALAAKAAEIANNMKSALEIDEEKGLAEPPASKVAEEAAKSACSGASDYLKQTKPQIQEDLEKASKKCCGGCCKKQKEKIKKKGGSCGAVRSDACSSSTSAAPGFRPGATAAINGLIAAAKATAEGGALPLAEVAMGISPSLITAAEGSPDSAKAALIPLCEAVQLCIESLIATQVALLGRMV